MYQYRQLSLDPDLKSLISSEFKASGNVRLLSAMAEQRPGKRQRIEAIDLTTEDGAVQSLPPAKTSGPAQRLNAKSDEGLWKQVDHLTPQEMKDLSIGAVSMYPELANAVEDLNKSQSGAYSTATLEAAAPASSRRPSTSVTTSR